MQTLLCAAVGTAIHQHGLEASTVCVETLLCAAVGTANYQHGLEVCNVYGNPTVRSCRHCKSKHGSETVDLELMF